MVENEMVWDLTQLLKSTDVVSIRQELESMVSEGERIREEYHGHLERLDAENLLKFLERKDAYILKFEGVRKYCRLMYSADTTDNVAKQLNDAVLKASTKVSQALAFIDIELGRLLAEKPQLVDSSLLAEYQHYLQRILKRVPHMLSEPEERLIIVKDRNGIDAWEKLQIDWLSTRTFEIEIDGEKRIVPYGRIIGFYESQDRNLRRKANQIVYENLGRDKIIWASALRAVCEDHMQMCKLRKYETPMTQSLIDNDVNQQTIDSLMKTIEKNVNLYRKYLSLKAKLMNLPKLANYDVVAPLLKAGEKDFSWREAQALVVEAYQGFDEEIGSWVTEMFYKKHLDGKMRKGKESGAFCASWLAGKSAYVLQTFNGKMGDVYTLAHELGHAIHAYLSSRAQKPSNCEIGSCIAETGSTFGELLLTEMLLAKAETKEEKQVILAHVLDGFGMAAFQVSARVLFERSMYDATERGEFLDGEKVAKLWVMARDRIYGDSVDWMVVMEWEWTMKPHYYIANYRFYNYPYVFAQLFVFALYRIYKEEGKEFAPKLKRLLAAGSSRSPHDLALELGFDIVKETFWEKGIQQAREFIKMLERTL